MKLKEYIKTRFIFLMLLVYVSGILKPLTPLAKDLIDHTFDKTHHMATIHFENGKYHVHKELAAESTPENPKKNTSENYTSGELLAQHLHPAVIGFNAYSHETSVIDTEMNTRVSDIFFKTLNPPPEKPGLILF